MSRATYQILIGDKPYRLRLHYDDPFPNYKDGYLRHYTEAWPDHDTTALIHVSKLHLINSLAVGVLRDRGYDLDGLRASFSTIQFIASLGDDEMPKEICRTLGDEYRFDTEPDDPCLGTIRRVMPRFSSDPLPIPWPKS